MPQQMAQKWPEFLTPRDRMTLIPPVTDEEIGEFNKKKPVETPEEKEARLAEEEAEKERLAEEKKNKMTMFRAIKNITLRACRDYGITQFFQDLKALLPTNQSSKIAEPEAAADQE
jgi:hypothetical protein